MIGIRFLLLPALLASVLGAVATTGPNSPEANSPEDLMKSGSYKEAHDQLAMRLKAPDAKPVELQQAIACLNQLNRTNETDAVLESVITQHGGRAEMLLQAATEYLQLVQHGALVAGKFVRGNPDGAGNVVNSHRRDEVRSVQLLLKALPLANAELRPQVLQKLSNALDKRGGLAWRLQQKSDFTVLPDYDEGWGYAGDQTAAPVDSENRPVFYATSASWDAAKNDGERWRWVLGQLAAKPQSAEWYTAQKTWADFCRSQFGVETLQQFGIMPRDGGAEETTSSILALSSLKDEETTARLATGVQRFPLPDEHHPLKIYAAIYAAAKSTQDAQRAQDSAATLADMHRNRRQFARAADWLRTAIAHATNDKVLTNLQAQLSQIVLPWGQFGSVQTQTPERGAQFEFRFRNAEEVEFSAQPIDTPKLLTDLREYLESNPKQLDWQKLDIENIGYQLVQGNQAKYLGAETARWKLPLKSPADHFDALETVTSPLQKAGAYLLTAKVKEGNTANVIVWVADTAIVRKPLADKMLYYVADAASGEPVAGATLDLLGYQQLHDDARPNRFRLDTRRFAANTTADGIAEVPVDEANFAPEKQWLVTATTPEGRFAFLGFSYVWRPYWSQPIYDQPRTIVITDRPVYRPGDTVKWKAWVGQAKYDAEGSPFAQVAFQAELHDAKGEKRETFNLTSNAFGGIEGEYKLPREAALGSYLLQILGHGAGNFRVEEYKKPEYEVTVEAPSEALKLGDKFKATVAAKYYFGSPVTKATVKYKVTRQSRTNRWFPPRPWDWLYGEGYGWMGGNYSWHPGWRRWGCVPPPPWWWPQNQQPPEIVAQGEAPLDAEGKLAIELDTALAKELHGDTDHEYSIEAQVVDASRRTIVGTGSVVAARKPFEIFVWINRGYVRTGDTITAHIAARRPDGKPITGAGVLTLKKITFENADSGEPTETEVQHWDLATGDNGEADLAFKASAEGQYRLSYTLAGADGDKVEGAIVLKILGPEFAGGEFRFDDLEVTLDKPEYKVGDTAKLLVSRNRPGGAVLLFVRPSEGVYPAPQVLRSKAKSSDLEIPITTVDQPNFFIEAVTIADGKVHVVAKQVVVPPRSRVLKVDVLPSATAYKPGAEATVKLRVTDEANQGFVGDTVVAIYDKSVEYISGGSNVPDIRKAFWDWKRTHNPNTEHSLGRVGYNLTPKGQEAMQSLGAFGAELQAMMRGGRGLGRSAGGMRSDSLMAMSADGMPMPAAAPMMAMAKSEMAEEKSAGGETAPLVQPTVRENFADTALWVGSLETDKEGVGEVKLTLPDSLTTWKIRVWSLGAGARVGEGSAEVVARKNLLIRLQTPRFLVETDEVILSGIVHNYLPEAKRVSVRLELDPDRTENSTTPFLTPLTDLEQTIEVPAGGEQRVDWRVKATAEGLATVRALALTDAESDAMQLKLPVVVHGIQKLESRSGVIATADNSGKMEFIVPDKRRPEQTTLTVQYSPTLAGAMVDALPFLLDYPHGCTEQTLNRFVPAVITQNTLRRMGVNLADIAKKRTNLNAQELGDPDERAKQWKQFDGKSVFDEAEMQKIVTTGVRRLSDMQLSDGGWGWFSGFGEQSSPHTTATVVRGLQVAQKNGAALLPETLPRGIVWLKNYQAEELAALANWRDGKPIDKDRRTKQFADNLDALVYLTLAEAGDFNATMRDRLYNDRTQLSPYSLAMFGIALQTQIIAAPADALTAQRDMVIRNLSQFVVRDAENQTAHLNLPRNYWWFWYGSEFEAHAYYLKLLAATDPKGDLASQLVKYLLNNRKNSTYWNSTRDTALVIEALADYLKASGEESPEMTVEVWLDGAKRQTVSINKENLFTFENRFVLAGEEVKSGRHEFELRKTGAGRLYYNGYLEVFTKEDDIRAAGLEVKVARKLFKLTPKDAKAEVSGARGQVVEQAVEKYDRTEIANLATIASGDLVEVELLITSKNDYEYLLITDPKPAGCESVDLNSGYNGNALGAFMEFRDKSVNLFVRSLPRGERSVTYRLRAETPGQFSALPTQIAAMYAPELRGNSDEVKIKIADK